MREVVARVKRRLYPSFALLERHLALVCRNIGCGGGGVFFRREHTKEALGGDPLMEHPHSEFGDCEYDLVASARFEESFKEFCWAMRSCEEGKRRCMECDRQGTRKVAARRRTFTYTCHAGLTDSMTPVVVHGHCVGVITVGMVLQDGRSPSDFEGVWERIADIPGLDRERMQKAYDGLTRLPKEAVAHLVAQIEQTAQSVAGLWENIVALAAQERQLAQAQLYREQHVAELLLSRNPPPAEEMLEMAQAVGLAGLPTAALVLQIDPTDRQTLALSEEEHHRLFLRLMEALYEFVQEAPGALPVSVAPGEATLLLHTPQTRNPHLRTLRLKETAERVGKRLHERLKVPVLMGMGPDYDDPARLSDSHREARRALWLVLLPDGWRRREQQDNDKILAQLGEILDNLQHALGAVGHGPASHAFEQALRVLATVGERAVDLRRILFVRMVDGFLDRLTENGADSALVEGIRLRCIYDFPALHSLDDMAQWVRAHLLSILQHDGLPRLSPDEQLLRQACRHVWEEFEAPPSRAATARHLGISESLLARLFQDRLGLPYREYLLRTRIARAQRLLLDPAKSVAEVARDVGYPYTSAFTRAFVRFCGCSPSEYRSSPRSYPCITLPGPEFEPRQASAASTCASLHDWSFRHLQHRTG